MVGGGDDCDLGSYQSEMVVGAQSARIRMRQKRYMAIKTRGWWQIVLGTDFEVGRESTGL